MCECAEYKGICGAVVGVESIRIGLIRVQKTRTTSFPSNQPFLIFFDLLLIRFDLKRSCLPAEFAFLEFVLNARYLAPHTLLLSVALAVPGTCAWAQAAGTGTIQGTVTDKSGAVVPNAKVTAVSQDTGRTAAQQTSSAGTYVLPALPPGDYSVTVELKGFSPVHQEHVIVNAISVVGLDLSLQAGGAGETVTVTATPSDLNTENGALDTTIPNSTYTALPVAMNGGPKSPLGFLSLVPGVASGDFGVENINGGSSNSSYLYINGLPLTTSEMQGDARNVNGATSTEVIDQFQIISSGVPAYYAGQGITNLVTKSGSNQLHGHVYENIRNTAFDAAGYFSTVTPVEHQNEYGGSLGGALVKDRFFFFGNLDRFKISNGNPPIFYNLPTAAERSGDFSALSVPIYDPASTVCNNGVCTRTAFSGNVIPAARLSSISRQLQSYLPATQNNAIQNNFASSLEGGTTQNMYLGKLDGAINSRQHAFALFQYGKNSPIGLPPNGGPQLPLPYTSSRTALEVIWLGQVGHTWTITPHVINVFGAQFNRFNTPFTSPTNGGGYLGKAGLTGLPSGAPSDNFPSVNFLGPNAPTLWASNNNTENSNTVANSFVYQDNLQWVRGRHSMTFGGQIIAQQEQQTIPNFLSGFNFSNNETAGFAAVNGVSSIDATTGNAYASYLLGAVDNAALYDTSVAETGARYRDYAVYAQDDWKITQRLTVNVGLRYIIAKPFVESENRNSWFNPALPNAAVSNYPGAVQFAGNGTDSCHCSTQVDTHYLTFDPRVGFAFSVTPKTVVRGSFTINHFNAGALGGNAQSQGTGLLGYVAQPSPNTPDSGITPAFNWATGFPAYAKPPIFDPTLNAGYNSTTGATGGNVTYNRPDTAARSPYTENWNLTVEQAFTPSLTLQISYAGSQSHFIPINGGVGIYSDQLDPKYMVLGGLLQQSLSPAVLAQAQTIVPTAKVPYANFVGTLGQALRPFPQYNSIYDPFADFGNASYHSLQTRLQQRTSHGLYFLASYTWSKSINNTGAVIAGAEAAPRSAYNLRQERAVAVEDIPQILSIATVYRLPFGRGQAFANSGIANAILGGWSISGIVQYQSGTPLGPILASCLVPYTGGCYADYGKGLTARINGAYGSGGSPSTTAYINRSAFADPASFTFGNTPRTLAFGLRNPWSLDEDVTVGRDLRITDRWKVRVQADAFNVFNRTVFGGIQTNIDSTNFGAVTLQSNSPRKLQLEGSISF
ncbi:TonB-dependent receptor [Granulicella tundricola]|uniref:TonB-dependent transporter Oar-like beta-barrel domain-containing protein n=1 Tax=Granulicella tundricola (strain ATCC BAA-1859 / DSM 23138 / MP5ACTX9) TaxID=1198114 RepID=E8X422_GRATM|nr:TonB-dependent receptor [Granulicella tundricola]ADW70530.1 hypothetical protein AciX9_3525 [Granulicella tundricola MP5ACTX9]